MKGETKIGTMADWSLEERAAKEKEWRQGLFTLRLQKATGQLDNPMRIRSIKRDIARLLTLASQGAPATAEASEAGAGQAPASGAPSEGAPSSAAPPAKATPAGTGPSSGKRKPAKKTAKKAGPAKAAKPSRASKKAAGKPAAKAKKAAPAKAKANAKSKAKA